MGRIRQLEDAATANVTATAQGDLQAKCTSLSKEREAVCVIMEQKIKVLVDSVTRAVHSALQEGGPQTNATFGNALLKVL